MFDCVNGVCLPFGRGFTPLTIFIYLVFFSLILTLATVDAYMRTIHSYDILYINMTSELVDSFHMFLLANEINGIKK